MKPNGNNGSVRQSKRDGDAMNSMSIGAYAMKIPSGLLMFNCRHFKVAPRFRFAPAESPGKEKRRHCIRKNLPNITISLSSARDTRYISYQRVSLFSLYFPATCSRASTPTRKRTILLRAREDREPRVLNYNLCSKLVRREPSPNFVSTSRASVTSATRIRHRDYE